MAGLAKFSNFELSRRHVENQLRSKRALEEGWGEALKICGAFIVHIAVTSIIKETISETDK